MLSTQSARPPERVCGVCVCAARRSRYSRAPGDRVREIYISYILYRYPTSAAGAARVFLYILIIGIHGYTQLHRTARRHKVQSMCMYKVSRTGHMRGHTGRVLASCSGS